MQLTTIIIMQYGKYNKILNGSMSRHSAIPFVLASLSLVMWQTFEVDSMINETTTFTNWHAQCIIILKMQRHPKVYGQMQCVCLEPGTCG